MKKISLVLFLLIPSSVLLLAQTQTGYVRTVGRPDNKAGERLPGVQIRVSGLHGSVVSNEQGDFDFDLQGGKDSYQLTSVIFDNYELNEKEIIGRTFGVTKVPQEIVMVSLAEKNKIRRKVEEQVEARYKVKYDDLRRKLESKEIEAEDYRKQLQELESVYDKREQLVSDMVERYSHTDYAVLKPIEAEINAFIEQGELEKADSVINNLNISKLEADRQVLIDTRTKIDESVANIDTTLLIAYNGKYEIYAADFQNDSAAYYLEKLVSIDTTNIENLLITGRFIQKHFSQPLKVMSYYLSALRNTVKQYGIYHKYAISSYINIGSLLYDMENFPSALESFDMALKLAANIGDYESIALLYGNIGSVYDSQGKYLTALDFYKKSLEIDTQLNSECKANIACTYNNIACVYENLGDYKAALDYYNKSLDIRAVTFGEISEEVACVYNNIGTEYIIMSDPDKALEFLEKALSIRMQIYGKNHPLVASTFGNIACAYNDKGMYSESQEYNLEALRIYSETYGLHSGMAEVLNGIGSSYSFMGQDSTALKCFKRATEIWLDIYGEDNPNVITGYSNVGYVCLKLGLCREALKAENKALEIAVRLYGDDTIEVASRYYNTGTIYEKLGEQVEAKKCFLKALKIYLKVEDDIGLHKENEYITVLTICSKLGKQGKAVEYFDKWANSISAEAGDDEINRLRMNMILFSTMKNQVPEIIPTFMKDKLYVMTINDGTPISGRGFSGEICILEYGDWTIDGYEDLYDTNNALRGKEKTLVFMTGGKIYKEHFEDTIGGVFGLKDVTAEERQSVINQYHKWKRQNAGK